MSETKKTCECGAPLNDDGTCPMYECVGSKEYKEENADSKMDITGVETMDAESDAIVHANDIRKTVKILCETFPVDGVSDEIAEQLDDIANKLFKITSDVTGEL